MVSQGRLRFFLPIALCGVALLLLPSLLAQVPKKAPPKPGPMLADGVENFDTPEFQLSLVRSSKTIAALHPKKESQFDFTLGDRLIERYTMATTIWAISTFA